MSQAYIFRYKLDQDNDQEPVQHRLITEVVKTIFGNLLNVATPLKCGKDLKIDDFR